MDLSLTTGDILLAISILVLVYEIMLLRKDIQAETISSVYQKWSEISKLEIQDPEFHKMLVDKNVLKVIEKLPDNVLRKRAMAYAVFDVFSMAFLQKKKGVFEGEDLYIRRVLTNPEMVKYWKDLRIRDSWEGVEFQRYIDKIIEEQGEKHRLKREAEHITSFELTLHRPKLAKIFLASVLILLLAPLIFSLSEVFKGLIYLAFGANISEYGISIPFGVYMLPEQPLDPLIEGISGFFMNFSVAVFLFATCFLKKSWFAEHKIFSLAFFFHGTFRILIGIFYVGIDKILLAICIIFISITLAMVFSDFILNLKKVEAS